MTKRVYVLEYDFKPMFGRAESKHEVRFYKQEEREEFINEMKRLRQYVFPDCVTNLRGYWVELQEVNHDEMIKAI